MSQESPAQKPQVIVCGACNVDLIAYVPEFPVVGETVKGTSFAQGWGGKGANQAVMAARLAGRARPNYVAMISKLGQDGYGRDTRANFEENGVDARHVFTCDDPSVSSGLAPITVNAKGDNQIVIIGGANDALTVAEIESCSDMVRDAKYMVCQLELPADITLAAMKLARRHGVQVILNTAPASTASSLPQELFRWCDIVCPNEPELALLSGMPVTTIDEAVAAVRHLLKRRDTADAWTVSQVLVTMGARGCLLVTADDVYHAPVVEEPDEKLGPVIDTVGAGDCFLGAFTYYLANGVDVREAMRAANVVAGRSVRAKGSQTSYPWRSDLPERVQL